MKPFAYGPAIAVRTLPARIAMLLKRLGMLALALAAWGVSAVHADATLTYELSGSESGKTVKRFSIARFFVRIDDPAETERYLLFQAGKFFPVYAVDTAGQTYTRLTPAVTPRLGPLSRSEPVADDSPDEDDDHAEHEDDDENTRRAESAPQNAAEDAARAESQEASSQPPAQQPDQNQAQRVERDRSADQQTGDGELGYQLPVHGLVPSVTSSVTSSSVSTCTTV